MTRKQLTNRIVLVSNRLPFAIEQCNDEIKLKPTSGGLVTAINPVLSKRGGLWVGWSGTFAEHNFDTLLMDWKKQAGYDVQPITLSKVEYENYYNGFSNEILWPLFHDLQSRCNFFNTNYWISYQQVNNKFAETVAKVYQRNDYIWIHDYQLINVGQELRRLGITSPIGFFLHIPFPPPDIFFKLPWRETMLEALLAYDLVGFQTPHDRNNFLQCVRILIKQVQFSGLIKSRVITIKRMHQQTKVGHFPIGIDYEAFAHKAISDKVIDKADSIRNNLPQNQIVFGVDRLDYTKGIACKLEAFRTALINFPDLHQKITLVQVIVPSRKDIPQYLTMKTEIERLISEINGQFTRPGWVPIHYIYRSLSRSELLAYYYATDIALVTSLKDGMNLVAKEYVAANKDGNGVLILSEFAGAADQLHEGALLVNPYNIEAVANAIYLGFLMPKDERRMRMQNMQYSVKKENVFWWVDSFLKIGEAYNYSEFSAQLKLIKNEHGNHPKKSFNKEGFIDEQLAN